MRFAWWGAEASGLLGSEHYVGQLSEAQADDIALYLNFDMIASPNYTFGIYDGDNSGGTAPPGFIPPGSAEIEDMFERFFTSRGEPFKDTEFSGRSTTARSAPSGSPPAACSPAPRCRRRRPRPRPSAASRARSWTPATTSSGKPGKSNGLYKFEAPR